MKEGVETPPIETNPQGVDAKVKAAKPPEEVVEEGTGGDSSYQTSDGEESPPASPSGSRKQTAPKHGSRGSGTPVPATADSSGDELEYVPITPLVEDPELPDTLDDYAPPEGGFARHEGIWELLRDAREDIGTYCQVLVGYLQNLEHNNMSQLKYTLGGLSSAIDSFEAQVKFLDQIKVGKRRATALAQVQVDMNTFAQRGKLFQKLVDRAERLHRAGEIRLEELQRLRKKQKAQHKTQLREIRLREKAKFEAELLAEKENYTQAAAARDQAKAETEHARQVELAEREMPASEVTLSAISRLATCISSDFLR